jgi:hypothetical protein
MAISLAEAVKLKSIISKKIQKLSQELHSAGFTVIEKGEQPTPPAYTLEMIEQDLKTLRKDARKLDALVYRANIENTIIFKEEEMPIVEAIELAIQLRSEASFAASLGLSEKESFYHSSSETILYRVALFDPEHYRLQALELEKDAHRLSNLINAKNYAVQIDFDDSNYF